MISHRDEKMHMNVSDRERTPRPPRILLSGSADGLGKKLRLPVVQIESIYFKCRLRHRSVLDMVVKVCECCLCVCFRRSVCGVAEVVSGAAGRLAQMVEPSHAGGRGIDTPSVHALQPLTFPLSTSTVGIGL